MRLTAKHKAERPGTGWGEVTWDVEVTNQNDEVVATYDLLTINAEGPPSDPAAPVITSA